jgi:hypothetical protein
MQAKPQRKRTKETPGPTHNKTKRILNDHKHQKTKLLI